jgi:hypothetical protein
VERRRGRSGRRRRRGADEGNVGAQGEAVVPDVVDEPVDVERERVVEKRRG